MDITLTEKEILEIALHHVLDTFEWEIGEGEFEIISLEIFGSRKNGTHRPDSDIDIKIHYAGDFSENAVFNILNGENQIFIEDLPLDFFPIEIINEF